MLAYRLLKNHAGLLLIGDYASLRELHEIVHDVNERSPLIREDDGPFLGLAYDVRKAYEQQREILQPPEGYEEIGVRYGVEILWPVLLVQQRMLRVSLGYLDHSRRHQAITYALEAVIEAGLREDFGAQAQTMVDHWLRLDPTPDIFEKLDSRGAMFCSWSKAERERRFASSTIQPSRTGSVPRNRCRPASWNNGKAWTGPIRVGNWNTALPRRLQAWRPDGLTETAVAARPVDQFLQLDQ